MVGEMMATDATVIGHGPLAPTSEVRVSADLMLRVFWGLGRRVWESPAPSSFAHYPADWYSCFGLVFCGQRTQLSCLAVFKRL